VITCTLASGSTPGTYTFTYTATVNANATGTIGNNVTATNPPGGDPDPTCASCTTTHPVIDAVNDSYGPINTAVGGTTPTVLINDTVGGNPISLGTNASLTPGTAPTPASGSITMNADGTITIAPGTTPGSYPYPYTICSIPATTPVTCDTAIATVAVAAPGATSITKASLPASGTTVAPGETISYTLTAVVSTNTTTENVTLTDTLSANQTLTVASLPATCTATGQVITCTLASGSAPGTYTFSYQATVNANATGTVGNNVTATNPPGGDPDPTCAACTTTHPVIDAVNDSYGPINTAVGGTTPTVLINDTVGGNPISLGTNASLTPGTAPTPVAGSITMNADGTITVVPGTTPGSYAYPYTICSVPATTPVTCDAAVATVVVAAPGATTITKTSLPASGTTVAPNEVVTYTLTAVVSTNTTTENVTLTDTLSANQTLNVASLPATCTATGQIVTCTLASGSAPGTYTFAYTATVNANATGTIGNNVTATNPPGGDPDPTCASCTTTHPVIDAVNDSYGPINTAVGGTTPTVLINDTVGGNPVNLGTNASLTPGTAPTPASGSITMNADGTITVTAGTTPGSYPYPYQICSIPATPPATCDIATATVVVAAPGATSITKTSLPASGTTVAPNEVVTYTLTAVVSINTTTEAITLTDTLSANQTFGTLTPPTTGSCTTGQIVTCTLPAGTVPGTYTFTYTATVNANATGSVGNNVTATNPPGGDPDPTCASCTTTHPVIDAVNDSYGPINTAVGGTTPTVLINDTVGGNPITLGTNASLLPGTAPVPTSGSITMNADGTITVAAGTTPGSYAYPYQICSIPATTPATCDTATATVVVAAPGATTITKTSLPASGTTVAPGETISYTLTAVVSTNTTTENITLTDTLSANQTFGTLTAPTTGSCTTGQVVTCTLPSGTIPGTYTFTYTATVNATATGTVGNNVTATNPPGGDPDPTCAACTTTHPVIDAVNDSYGPINTAVGGTTPTVLINDTVGGNPITLGTNASLLPGTAPVPTTGSITMNADGTITVAAGTTPGSYPYPYQICSIPATTPATCDIATATVVVAAPGATSITKTSLPASGTTVAPNEIVTYTLTAVVSTNTTTENITLTDTLSANQTFGTLTPPTTGSCTTGQVVTCTLPSGTIPGTYTFTYTATVNANATGTIGNNVTATNPPGGDPDPTCASCTTTHPVIDAVNDSYGPINTAVGGTTPTVLINDTVGGNPVNLATNASLTPGTAPTPVAGSITMNADGTITVTAGTTPGSYPYPYQICSIPATTPATCDTAIATVVVAAPGATSITKTSLPASGTTVAPNEVVTYTLTAVVSINTTTEAITLTDTLSANQTFGTLTAPTAGSCTTGQVVTCTLPSGTIPGTYTFTYTATVNANATGAIGNNVTATNPPGGDPDPTCASCTTTHPVIDAVDDSYGPINSGSGGTTPSVLINDTVGGNPVNLGTNASLTPGASPNAGLVMNADGTITVAVGTAPNTYLYPYTICSIPATTPVTCDTAIATVVVAAPGATSISKASLPASGTTVAPNEVVTYTLTAVVSTNITTQAITLTDTLSANQTFGTLTPPTTGSCTTGQIVTCTLPSGTIPGTYTFTYTATVNANATGTVGNSVIATKPPGGDPNPTCSACTTTHPVIDAVNDSYGPINSGSGGTTASVLANDTVGGNPVNVGVNATLSPGGSPNAGLVMNADGTITVAPGTTPNTYLYPYTICSIPATTPATCDSATATVIVSAAGATSITKTSLPASGTVVAPNKTITYTLTAVVSANTTTQAITLTDTLSANQTFGTLTPPTTGSCTTGQVITCTLPAGTVPGTYTFTYTAIVNANATGTVGNSVVATKPPGGDPNPTCASCTTTHPVIDAVNDTYGPINNTTSGTTGSVIVNDTVGGVPAVIGSTVTLTPGTAPTPPQGSITMNADGTITVAIGTTAGAYTYPYTICSVTAPTSCDSATATVTVTTATTCTLSTGSAVGFIWDDKNRNGIYEPNGADGIAGTSDDEVLLETLLTLTPTGGTAADAVIISTDSSGHYVFPNLAPGSYELSTLNAYLGDNFNLFPAGSSTRTIVITACGQVETDFAYAPPQLGVVGDFVWFDQNKNGTVDEFYDANGDGQLTLNPSSVSAGSFEWVDVNGNGIPDAGEYNRCGLSGVTVELLDTGGNVVATQVTDIRGAYFFTGLALGQTYTTRVDASDPANFARAQQVAASGLCKPYPATGPSVPTVKRSFEPAQQALDGAGSHVETNVGAAAALTCSATTPLTRTSTLLTVASPVDETLDFGLNCAAAASSFDPPFITKSVTPVDAQTLTWTIVVDNDANAQAQNSQIRDPMPAGMTFVNGQITCTAFGSSTVSDCYFDTVNNRVVADALLASDLGVTSPANAPNRLVITFQARFTSNPIAVTNVASACWDAANNTANVTACTTSQTASAQYAPLPGTTPIPVNSRWMLALIALLMAGIGAFGLPRRGISIR